MNNILENISKNQLFYFSVICIFTILCGSVFFYYKIKNKDTDKKKPKYPTWIKDNKEYINLYNSIYDNNNNISDIIASSYINIYKDQDALTKLNKYFSSNTDASKKQFVSEILKSIYDKLLDTAYNEDNVQLTIDNCTKAAIDKIKKLVQ